MMMKRIFPLLCALLPFASCQRSSNAQNGDTAQANAVSVSVPVFNADSAYAYIDRQVAFGPRVPNSPAHDQCAEYLIGELQRHGATVIPQKAQVTAYDGTVLHITNIIGSFQPENPKRILLFAHWDTRPWADHDADPSQHRTPILGANDGASGVGALLEMARLVGQQKMELGVDFIFFDAEDYGTPEWDAHHARNDETTWCLGSQYWSSRPHKENYTARYGILLDMVGGKGATFYQEGFSRDAAPGVVDKVWKKAAALGYGHYFIPEAGGYVTDDHLFVNRMARIPSIDIIPTDRENGGFGFFWHTQKDDMEVIDKNTLKAVGQTVTEVIYNEK